MTRKTTYYELLDAARSGRGCSLCHVEAKSLKRYFDSLLHENVNNPEVRKALARSSGYCHRHAHYLRSYGNALGIAILYHDQVSFFLRLLADADSLVTGAVRKREKKARRLQICPACRVQDECRSHYCSAMIESVHDAEMRAALTAGGGICVPHFLDLLDVQMDSETRTFLVTILRQKMTTLLEELEAFIKKHDHRFNSLPFGCEADSWSRAIDMMVGEELVF